MEPLSTLPHPFLNTNPLLEEMGWRLSYNSWYPNSNYNIWVPAVQGGPVEDIYVFDYHHNNSGHTIQIVWANDVGEAKVLVDSTIHGIPSFYPKTIEQLSLLLTVAIS